MPTRFLLLLIDDDYDDQDFFKEAISSLSGTITCETVADCVKAIDLLKNPVYQPDLIFLDINMPMMNGVECLAEIRKMAHRRDIPVYMYSTSAEKNIVDECKKLGSTGFIRKEPDLDCLQGKIREILVSLNMLPAD